MTAKRPTRLMTLHALTFLHPGTGQTTGVVDLPVQREVHTGFPMIASSGLKGAMREKAEQDWQCGPRVKTGCDKVNAVFGPDTGQGEAAGALAVTDARILLLPVRSLQKVFLWVTCPMVINRLVRDAELAGITLNNVSEDIQVSKDFALPPTGSSLSGHVVLEELRLNIDPDPGKQTQCKNIVTALQSLAPGLTAAGVDGRLVLVGNDDFQYLCRYALQVSARIALTGGKTTGKWHNPVTNQVESGNLWYEETLPPETVMYSLLLSNEPRYQGKSGGSSEASGGGNAGSATPPKNAQEVISAIDGLLDGKFLQVGGNETVGQGWCCVALTGNAVTAQGCDQQGKKAESASGGQS